MLKTLIESFPGAKEGENVEVTPGEN